MAEDGKIAEQFYKWIKDEPLDPTLQDIELYFGSMIGVTEKIEGEVKQALIQEWINKQRDEEFEKYLDSLSPTFVTYMMMTVEHHTIDLERLMDFDFTYYPWAHQRNFAYKTTIDGKLVKKEDGKVYLHFDDESMRDDILADSEDGEIILARCEF